MTRYKDILAYPGSQAAATLQRYHALLNHWRTEMEQAEDKVRKLRAEGGRGLSAAIKRLERAEEFYRHWRDKFYGLQRNLQNER